MDETWHETTCFRVDKKKNERHVKGQVGHALQITFVVWRKRNFKSLLSLYGANFFFKLSSVGVSKSMGACRKLQYSPAPPQENI